MTSISRNLGFLFSSVMSFVCMSGFSLAASAQEQVIIDQSIEQQVQPVSYTKPYVRPATITPSWQLQQNTKRALTTKDRKYNKPRYIMLHHSAMSSDEGLKRELESSLFAHFSVLKSGQIFQHLDTGIVAEGSWDRSLLFQSDAYGNVNNKIVASGSTTPIDRMAIHIEVNYAPQKGEQPNSYQYEALATLVTQLSTQYNIPPNNIIGHSSVQTCGSNWFKDSEGDWFRLNEPSGIMYQYSNSGGCRPTFSNGIYTLTSMMRAKGLWKDGIYANMTDRQVANIIYKANYGNAEQLLNRVGGRSVASQYRALINQLRD
jgi:N-acetyl-anhydromuramyl-L-alanine amidase AmpD